MKTPIKDLVWDKETKRAIVGTQKEVDAIIDAIRLSKLGDMKLINALKQQEVEDGAK